MLYRLRKRAERTIFERLISGIWETPPIGYKPGCLTIISQTSHSDLPMYLLAVKSLYRQIGFGAIAIVDDGTLTEDDKRVLNCHLVDPKIIPLEEIDVSRLVKGGTWERLAYSVELAANSYVIQVDSDVLVTGGLDEVCQMVAENRAFILGTWNGQRIVDASEASAYAGGFGADASRHIQSACERSLPLLDCADQVNYVRGSSGFYGFPKGTITRSAVESLCHCMTEILGARFREWGSEQFAANFLVANAPNARVLPYPKYAVFGPELNSDLPHLFHFIGAYRYSRGEYARRGRACIRQLSQELCHRQAMKTKAREV